MQPGLKHIAEECGVSAMAVSMALRNDNSISKQRRKEIKTVAERMGYRPNINARSLRGGKTHSVGILWPLGGPHDSIGLIRDVSLKLMDNDYVSYIADSLSDPKIVKSCLKDYVNRNVDGVIIQLRSEVDIACMLEADAMQFLKQIGNVIIVNDTETDLPVELQYDVIKRQRQTAREEIIDYLVKQGRQRIVLLSRELNPWEELKFIACFKTHGLDYKNSRLIVPKGRCVVIPDKIFEQFGAVLSKYDAILTSSDEIAAQVINYLQKQGLNVPEDIAVIGFNNSLFGKYFTPPIASVERRSPELADILVDFLIKQMKNKNTDLQQLTLAMHFIKRESAG